MTWGDVIRERPERIEVDVVRALPRGGYLPAITWPAGVPRDPLTIYLGDEAAYHLWVDGEDVAYWRNDIWQERFGKLAVPT